MAKGLKVGDLVRHKGNDGTEYGIVTKVEGDGRIVIDACRISHVTTYGNEYYYEKLTTPKVTPTLPYRAGDVVEITWERHKHRGKRAYIYQVTHGVGKEPDVLAGYLMDVDRTIPVILLATEVKPVEVE